MTCVCVFAWRRLSVGAAHVITPALREGLHRESDREYVTAFRRYSRNRLEGAPTIGRYQQPSAKVCMLACLQTPGSVALRRSAPSPDRRSWGSQQMSLIRVYCTFFSINVNLPATFAWILIYVYSSSAVYQLL